MSTTTLLILFATLLLPIYRDLENFQHHTKKLEKVGFRDKSTLSDLAKSIAVSSVAYLCFLFVERRSPVNLNKPFIPDSGLKAFFSFIPFEEIGDFFMMKETLTFLVFCISFFLLRFFYLKKSFLVKTQKNLFNKKITGGKS